jgi:hypothetical protein
MEKIAEAALTIKPRETQNFPPEKVIVVNFVDRTGNKEIGNRDARKY